MPVSVCVKNGLCWLTLEKQCKLPERLVRARVWFNLLSQQLVNRYVKSFARMRAARLQKSYDEIFCKFAKSPTWLRLCQQVFDQYLGQYSFTPVTQIDFLAEELGITSQSHVLELAPGTGV
jgi:hypothetical protein